MKVLVACEESQAVTIALRAKGIEAYSCDLQPCSGGHPEWHIQGDAITEAYSGNYGAMIAHPTCKYIANSGAKHLYNDDKSRDEERWSNLDDACIFFKKLLDAPISMKVIENPIPHKHAVDRIGRKYDQLVQPYMFGHPESKATCLWIVNLPKLKETNNVKHIWKQLPKKEAQKMHYLPPGPDREKLRSKTYKGIAEAIAEQYYEYFK